MNGRSYYNEHDPYAAAWLRNLIAAGHIAPGDVDERSIVDVRADDLRGYSQCHFFAGIGGWSIALRLAGWPDDRPVWTGSCPCQPFSAAGAGKAADDERHLWPAWFPLIAERKPAIVFGEQVEAAIGWGWLDAVFSDLEGEGYACGASVLPACGIGAPHIRQRLWFVADASNGRREPLARFGGIPTEEAGDEPLSEPCAVREDGLVAHANGRNASTEGLQRSGEQRQQPQDGGAGELADAEGGRSAPGRRSTEVQRRSEPQRAALESNRCGDDHCAMGHASSPRLQERERNGCVQREAMEPSARQAAECGSNTGVLAGFWSDAEWIPCTDGKARPVGPGSFPLGHGIQNRASKLRAYGNAIVPQVAAEFIAASIEATNLAAHVDEACKPKR